MDGQPDAIDYHLNPNRRVWSDEDLRALAAIIRTSLQEEHTCAFDEETRVALKRLSKADPNVLVRIAQAAESTTNFLWKGLLGLALVALLWLALVGFAFEKKIAG